jgi:HD-GYP domain-containing protein (c-di-GMP phosphodiesterase class II)
VRELLANADDPKELAIIAADALIACGDPVYVSVNELIPGTGILMPIVERGSLELDADMLRRGLSALSHEAIINGGERWLVDDGKDLDAITCRRLGVKAILIVPLQRLNRGVGAIHIAWRTLDDPLLLGDALAQANELAEWITPDLTIARVAGEIERGYISAMASMSASLDDRDVHTRGHSRRVAKVALEIAELMELSEHEQRQLVYAAEMHDLGKVGVSDRILGKAGALTDEEWSAIRAIPALSADIVEPVSFFGDVHEAIRHMRERWDGGGYPDGQPGTQIPILARILAVADAYDAMTSPRPYRDALIAPDALRQLWRERARAYDPEIVDLFVMSQAPGRSH